MTRALAGHPAAVALVCCAAALAACAGDRAEDVVRARFPAQAPRVLGEGSAHALERSPEGFRASPRRGATANAIADDAGMRVVLPSRGEDAVRFELADGFRFEVRELGARGEGRLERGAVIYGRERGASFWSESAGGAEEWLYLARPGSPARVEWEVEGAALVERSDGIDVADARGRSRVRVSAPQGWGADGRPAALRLWAEGNRLVLSAAGEGPLLLDPLWRALPTTQAGDPLQPRLFHTATELGDKIVVIGGKTAGTFVDPVLVFDKASGQWSVHAAPVSLWKHSATAVGDAILVAGGEGPNGVLPTAFLWTLADGPGTPIPMTSPRMLHVATRTPDGAVLLVGGQLDATTMTPTVEALWSDSPAGPWRATAVANTSTSGGRLHTVSWVTPSRLMKVGGCTVADGVRSRTDPCVPTEIAIEFDYAPGAPPTVGGRALALAGMARAGHTALLVPPSALPSAYRPASGESALVVIGGVAPGGQTLNSVALLDPSQSVGFVELSIQQPLQARVGHTATLLSGGAVLVVGGFAPNALLSPPYETRADAELLDLLALTSAPEPIDGAPAFDARGLHQATPFRDAAWRERLLVTGGTGDPGSYWSTLKQDLATAAGVTPFSGVLELGAAASGTPCAKPTECASGVCEDSVCCDRSCGRDPGDCQACSIEAGARENGVCSPLAAGRVCRPAGPAMACDAAETCDGSAVECPADSGPQAGVVCRAKDGDCDVEELCVGSPPSCPADAFALSGAVCRPTAGGCDPVEKCAGDAPDCPGDVPNQPGCLSLTLVVSESARVGQVIEVEARVESTGAGSLSEVKLVLEPHGLQLGVWPGSSQLAAGRREYALGEMLAAEVRDLPAIRALVEPTRESGATVCGVLMSAGGVASEEACRTITVEQAPVGLGGCGCSAAGSVSSALVALAAVSVLRRCRS